MVIGTERNIGRYCADVGGAVRRDNQRKIGDIACGMISMCMASPFKVSTGGLEIRRFVKSVLMNVDGVCAGRKMLDIERDFNTRRRGG